MKLSSLRKHAGQFVFNHLWTPPKENSLRVEKTAGDYGHAYYYEELFSGDGADILAAVEICRNSPGPVLDLGGGAGRLSIALSSRGIPVKLVDCSDTMLETARAKRLLISKSAREILEISPQDMTRLHLDECYQNIFSLNCVLEHFSTDEQLLSALRSVNRHLKQSGRYHLDVHFPLHFIQDPLWKKTAWRYAQDTRIDGHRFRVWSRTIPAEEEQSIICDHAISEDLMSFKLLRTTLRFLPYEKWIALFEMAGFKVLETWGNWKKEPISPLRPKLVFTLGK